MLVTFGEVLLRLSPPGAERLATATTAHLHLGGAEANVAAAAAGWGVAARHVTAVPPGPLGDRAEAELRRVGIDMQGVRRTDGRLGLYWLEQGAGLRPPSVVYDRADSAFVRAGAYDWEALLDGATWFHWTGVTAALGDGPRQHLRAALAVARRTGVQVSVDLNYRARLWSPGEAQAAMPALIEGADLVIAGREDADPVLGIPSGATTDDPRDEAYGRLAERLRAQFGAERVALGLRHTHSASRHGFGAVGADGQGVVWTDRRDTDVVDRVGGGDAFAAGVLYGLMQRRTFADALAFGVGASLLKLTVPGDQLVATVEEVERVATTGSAQVRR